MAWIAVIIGVGLISGVGLSSIFAQENFNIPAWVKNNALWWGQGQISDSDFISAMEYLIDNKILKVSNQGGGINLFKEGYEDLQVRYNELSDDYDRLSDLKEYWQKRATKAETKNIDLTYGQLTKQLEQNQKPLTTIEEQNIHWSFADSKGNRYSWSMPVDTYENLVAAPQYYAYQNLRIASTGENIRVIDYTKFVGTSFSKVIDDVYTNSNNEDDFIYEVWYIVSQLTTYSTDINYDNPRYALETFSRGGGDCEDTSILIADMLKSSSHSRNWKIQLLYFDADHPKDPQTVNHAVVVVDTGKSYYVIESTAKNDGINVWAGQRISGWYFDV